MFSVSAESLISSLGADRKTYIVIFVTGGCLFMEESLSHTVILVLEQTNLKM